MSNNISFSRSPCNGLTRSPCQARNSTPIASQFSIVYGIVPVWGYGTFNLALYETGLPTPGANPFLPGTYQAAISSYAVLGNFLNNDDWPNVWQIVTENWTFSNGATKQNIGTWSPYGDLGLQLTQTNNGIAEPGDEDNNTITTIGVSPDGTLLTIDYAYPSGTATYTAQLSNKWMGNSSLSAWWSALTSQANTLLANITPVPQSVESVTMTNLGSGYALSDELIPSGGTLVPGSSAPVIQISGVTGGGGITGFSYFGSLGYSVYTSFPTLINNPVTGGSGTGATFNLATSPCDGVNMISPISTGSGWTTGIIDGTYLCYTFLAAANGFAMRGNGGGIVPFAASIVNLPTPYPSGTIQANIGFCLCAKSIWALTGIASGYSGDTLAPTSVYIQPMSVSTSLSQGSVTAASTINGSAITNPLNMPVWLISSPSDIGANGATYGVIGFRNPAA